MVTINEELLRVLKLARDHLEYCGYGDSYERDCARDEGLPRLIEQTIKRAEGELVDLVFSEERKRRQ